MNTAQTGLDYLVWSVPLIIAASGEPLAMDPLSGDEGIDILLGRYSYSGDIIEDFVKAVLYSNLASALALVHDSLRPLLTESFLAPALRYKLGGPTPSEARAGLEPKINNIYENNLEKIARSAALAFVRDYYWASGWSLTPSKLSVVTGEDVAAWLLAKAGIGRVFLPEKPSKPRASDYIADFVSRRARSLLRMVEREQAEIYSDEVYLRFVGVA